MATNCSDIPGRVWCLNLDADMELANPEGYRPDPRVQARIAGLIPSLDAVLGPGAQILGVHAVHSAARAGLCWCPTPHALRRLAAEDLHAPTHPPLHVLQRVNRRSFCAELGQTLPGAEQIHDMAALRSKVSQPSPTGDWVLKRPHGFAGRERRRAIGGKLDPSTEGFALRAFAHSESLQVEPWVQREGDFSQHGWLSRAGTLFVSPPVGQRCDPMGRFLGPGAKEATPLEASLAQVLDSELQRAATALHTAGYFGPFGLDAYVYRDGAGRRRFNPRSEINARFTMGYRWPKGVDPFNP